MAYLTEHLSRKEPANAVRNKSRVRLDQTASNSTSESAENRNFQIAHNLNEERAKLIAVLAQFPVTALCLLERHEQCIDGSENDDEVNLASDLANAIADVKKCFLKLSQYQRGIDVLGYVRDKQNLSVALQVFPYSFDDLVNITDVIVYAFKFRGLNYQPEHAQNARNADVASKRLQGSLRRKLSQPKKLADLFSTDNFSDYDEQFLFLPSNDMHSKFFQMVYAEHRWLSARQELAAANHRLVLFIANQYKASFLDFDDLVQEGQTGLLKAVDRFDHRLGFQFSTYAGYWIRQAISRSLSRCERLVRVPCGQVANINKVFRAKNELSSQTGKEPTVKDLAEYTKLTEDEINTILSISQTALSLEGPEDEEDSFAPIDFLEQQVYTHAFTSIAEADLEQLLSKAIETLNPREAKIICAHFGVDADREMTLQEIGSELNLTRERVRQIQVMALSKMRENFGQQLLCFM